jgi:predicted NACHT family NTPase
VRTWTSNGGEGHRLVGHEGKVFSVAYNPAGNRIVSASADRTVRVWNASAADPALLVLRGHAGPVWSAAFNHDATRIVSSGEDGTVRTWNATTGEQERVFEGHTGRVFSAAFSHDGVEIVSAGEDQTVRIWNANDEAQQPIVLEEHQSRVWSAAFRPGDRTQLASASQDKLVLTWETGGPGNPVTYGMAEDVIGQPPEVFAAVAVLAPTLGASLLAGDVTVADLVPPLAADSATPWGSFRAAAGQWLSATIPEIGKKEDGNGDRPYPENLFEIASGARARLQRHLGGARQPLHGAGRGGCQGFRDLAPLHAGTRRVGVRAA